MDADSWIFETCPRYTAPGGVFVQPPVWGTVPRGMSAFRKNLTAIVARGLRRKEEEGKRRCGDFETWFAKKRIEKELEERRAELTTISDTKIREGMRDIFRRSSFFRKPTPADALLAPNSDEEKETKEHS